MHGVSAKRGEMRGRAIRSGNAQLDDAQVKRAIQSAGERIQQFVV